MDSGKSNRETNISIIHAAAVAAKSLQSCPTLCNPMDCSPPDSSVHGIFQARVLEWGAIAFSAIIHEGQEYMEGPGLSGGIGEKH